MLLNDLINKADVKKIKNKKIKKGLAKTSRKNSKSLKKDQINCLAEIIVNQLFKNELFYE